MPQKKKEAQTQTKEVKNNDGSQGNDLNPEIKPDEGIGGKAKEMAGANGVDDKVQAEHLSDTDNPPDGFPGK